MSRRHARYRVFTNKPIFLNTARARWLLETRAAITGKGRRSEGRWGRQWNFAAFNPMYGQSL